MYNGKKLVVMWSGGKDSTALLEACKQLGYEVDLIRHTRVMFDKDTPADLPKVYKWIQKTIKKLSKMYDVPYEIIDSPYTFKDIFFSESKKYPGEINGYPLPDKRMRWCRNEMKIKHYDNKNEVRAIGIAIDEQHRCEKNNKNIIYPLCELNWTEAYCMDWCRERDLLSPTYTDDKRARSGCFFCHLQTYEGMKKTRKYYPEIWKKWMELDAEGKRLAGEHTVPLNLKDGGIWLQEYDKRIEMEEKGLVPPDKRFRWKLLDKNREDMKRVLFLDYSYESIATLQLIKQMQLRLDEVRTLRLKFDEETEADYPENIEYKNKVNKWIEETLGIKVKVIFHEKPYTHYFFKDFSRQPGRMQGYPHLNDRWCRFIMKEKYQFYNYEDWEEIYYKPLPYDRKDEMKEDLRNEYPLIDREWTHEDCVKVVKRLGLEAPREDDFCWFCPFMKIDRLKEIRNRFPELWKKWLEVDKVAKSKWNGELMESPVRMKGRWWLCDFDKRWRLEAEGKVPADRRFKWKMLEEFED